MIPRRETISVTTLGTSIPTTASPGTGASSLMGDAASLRAMSSPRARIVALGDDTALWLAASPIRLEAPVPGEAVVGIEVPNVVTEMVSLRGIMENPAYAEKGGALKLALGRDVSGKPLIADLAKMPHLLIAGATGSGKSVCINSLIVALLLQNSPDRLQLMLIDPKQVEMKSYEGTPHLLSPVITDMEDVC